MEKLIFTELKKMHLIIHIVCIRIIEVQQKLTPWILATWKNELDMGDRLNRFRTTSNDGL
jgi:hypothetical protein